MLTAVSVQKAAPKDRDYFLCDSDHLYLRVKPTGRKAWIVRYMRDGRAGVKMLGVYPDLTLAEARAKRDQFLTALRRGDVTGGQIKTVKDVADDWLRRRNPKLAPSYVHTIDMRVKNYILPAIGARAVADVTRPQLISFLLDLHESGREETAARTAALTENIFQHALNLGLIPTSPAQYLTKALPPRLHGIQHFQAAVETPEIQKLLRAIATIQSTQTRSALMLIAYTGVRVGELLKSEQSEFDFARDVWLVPAEHMKRRLELVVPLSSQAKALAQQVIVFNRSLGYSGVLMFPTLRKRKDGADYPITEASLLKALKMLCWSNPGTPPVTVHGFRSTMSSVLNSNGWNTDAIERQLAHVAQGIRGIYNRSEYMDIRRPMLQWYADWLDALRDGVPLPTK